MIRALSFLLITSSIGCEPPGPTPEEVAANRLEKRCARLYEGQTKVYRDALYKQQIPEAQVKFAEKDAYVAKCIEANLTDDQMRCLDPNLRDAACEATMKEVSKKEGALKAFLFGPMSKSDTATEPQPTEAPGEPTEE